MTMAGLGRTSVENIFEFSSNVGMAKIITNAYKDNPVAIY